MQERIAVPVYNGRVSPVFDTAQRLLVIEAENAGEVGRSERTIALLFPPQRAQWLAEQAVNTLICGAISMPLANMIQFHGIRLLPWVAGNLEEVIQAYFAGNLQMPRFAMPGCCGGGRRFRGSGGRMRGRMQF